MHFAEENRVQATQIRTEHTLEEAPRCLKTEAIFLLLLQKSTSKPSPPIWSVLYWSPSNMFAVGSLQNTLVVHMRWCWKKKPTPPHCNRMPQRHIYAMIHGQDWDDFFLLHTQCCCTPSPPCSPLEYCFCSVLSTLTFGRVCLSVLQLGDDSFCLLFYRIWQLAGKEHEDIQQLSVTLSCLLTLSTVFVCTRSQLFMMRTIVM